MDDPTPETYRVGFTDQPVVGFRDYVNGTREMGAYFIQLRRSIYPEFEDYTSVLSHNGIRVKLFWY